jgi:hypothetical protein
VKDIPMVTIQIAKGGIHLENAQRSRRASVNTERIDKTKARINPERRSRIRNIGQNSGPPRSLPIIATIIMLTNGTRTTSAMHALAQTACPARYVAVRNARRAEGVIFLPNVKEHAPLSARASVDHGVEVENTHEHENRAADRGCCVSTCSASCSSLGGHEAF